MPVPTQTLRNMKLLNVIFAASSVIMTVSLLMLVVEDNNREWRQFQQDAQDWKAAIFIEEMHEAEAAENAALIASMQAELEAINRKLA